MTQATTELEDMRRCEDRSGPSSAGSGVASKEPSWDRKSPIGRRGTPEDVAMTIRFLCTEAAAFITGETVVVDGGSLSY